MSFQLGTLYQVPVTYWWNNVLLWQIWILSKNYSSPQKMTKIIWESFIKALKSGLLLYY